MPFDYPVRPYRISLTDYFVKELEIQPRLQKIGNRVGIDREIELRHLFHQLQLGEGTPRTSISMVIAPLSLNQASLLSLCFLKEITDDGVAMEPIEVIDRVIPYDEY